MLINPSVLCRHGRLLLAARAMWAVSVQPPCTDVWRSHAILTSVAFDASSKALQLAPSAAATNASSTGTGGRACIADLTAEREDDGGDGSGGSSDGGSSSSDGNAQALRCARLGLPPSVGLGMEDPRLFDVAAAASDDVGVVADATAAAASVGSGVLISFSAPRRQQIADCAMLTNRRAIQLMPLQPLARALPLQWAAAANASDRNWLLFQRRGSIFAVFSIEPHIILRVGRGGSCEERHRTSNRFLSRRFAERVVHGGANPLLVSTSHRSFYFVSIFHTKDRALQYENYAYTFSAEPPFRITAIGRKPLTLRGKRVRFVSSLTYLGHHRGIDEAMVGVSYGSDDSEGRVAILPLRVLLREMQDVTALSVNASRNSDRLQLPSEAASSPPLAAAGRAVTVGQTHDGPGHCFLMPGVRYDAPSIRQVAGIAAAKQCCALCRDVEYCSAFSWSPADKGTCWLKQWTGTAVQRDGFVSGHFGRRASCACDVSLDSTLRLANSSRLSRTPAASYTECCAACMQHDGCGAWSWSKGQRGGCSLHQTPSAADQLSSSALYTPSAGHVAGLATLKRSVLFVHHTPPQQRFGSDRRLLALLKQVQRLGWQVNYAGADDYDPGPVRGRKLLAQMGVPLLSPVDSAEALVSFVKAHDVSVVVLCLWFWGQQTVPTRYLRALRTRMPHLKLVVMSDDVHHLRLKLEAEDERRPAGKQVTRVRDEELKTYFFADHVLTISDTDKASILQSLPPARSMHEARFSTLRHVYADGVIFPLERRAAFGERFGLVFVGNLNNPTNLYGMKWFMGDVWPALRKAEPRMTLHVVGSLDGEFAAASGVPALLKETKGVQASGYVTDEDLGRVLQEARVFVVPIRWATGIVTKQTLAHVHGLPTVVTPTAARHVAPAPLDAGGSGDAWSHLRGRYVPTHVAAVAESAADYAAAILHVHRNESAWEELSQNGARYARSGGGGKGVCPSGLADDWLKFWAKLQTGVCTGTF